MSEKQTRKLAVVMFADIVGYTSMVQRDEAAALARVDIHRKALQQNTAKYNGQVITFYGDGSLSTYPSAIDAVKCALEMQEAYREHDVPVRIGMHLGDIVYRGDSVYGDGVNVASRVESQGVAGSILMSAKLQQEIVNHPEIQTKSLGFYKLKNVKNRTELYAVTNPGLAVPSGRKRVSVIKKVLMRGGLAVILALLIGYFLYDKLIVPAQAGVLELREQKVAVRFQDFAQIPDRLEIPSMASHWIGNRLRTIPGANVVNYQDALDEPNILVASAGVDKRREFARRTNAVTVLEGTIYRQGTELLFEAHIYDLETGESQKAFEVVKCDVSDPMQGISDLGNKILGWWATKDDIVYSVPNYEAYQLYLEAREVWEEDDKLAEVKLKESISADTTFIDPYFLVMELYTNNVDYVHRDSLLDLIKSRFKNMTSRQRSLMDVYEAEARGDLIQTYQNYQAELASDPLDILVNTAGVVQATQYVNQPREAIYWFNMIPPESLDYYQCEYCQTRLRLATSAYLQLGKVDSAIYVSSILPPDSEQNMRYKLLPFVSLEDTARINRVIAEFNTDRTKELVPVLQTDMALRFKLKGRDDLAKYYCETALSHIDNPDNTNATTVECNYLLGNYDKVIELLENVWPLSKYPDNEYVLIWTSRAYAHAGSDEDRERVVRAIQNVADFKLHGYGRDSYLLAVMANIEGNKEKSLSLLEKAHKSGHRFTIYRYQNDIDLIPLFDDPQFQRITNPLGN